MEDTTKADQLSSKTSRAPLDTVMTRQWILVADDDQNITEGLAATLDRPDRTVVVCSDVESAEVALARYPITHVVSDVQFSGEFGFEGFHFLKRLHSITPALRIVLITGSLTEALRVAALEQGASAVVGKPFTTDELEEALAGGATVAESAEGDSYDVIRAPGMGEILSGGDIYSVFQPIVRLDDGEVSLFGFEALTRVEGRWFDRGPAPLFDYAVRRSCLAELNLVTLRKAIFATSELPPASRIFLNLDPITMERPDVTASVEEWCAAAGLDPRRLVIEITERSPFSDAAAALRTIDGLREMGVRFALDDHGAAYSHLGMVDAIRPAFFKISPSFGSDFERDSTHSTIIQHIASLAASFGSETILEGVESAATAQAARELGISLAQGFYFGRPDLPSRWCTGLATAA